MSQDATDHDNLVYQDLRERLIDRSRRNRLLNFRHSPSAPIVRVVDTKPDFVMAQLRDDVRLRFRPLPAPNPEPEDEQTPEFIASLQRAALDDAYQEAVRSVDPDDPSSFAALARLERDLRDKVRNSMKLPRRQHVRDIDATKHARSLGIPSDYDLAPANQPQQQKRADNSLQTLMFPNQLKTKLSKISHNTRAIEQETGVNTLYLAVGFLEWFESESSDVALLSPLLLMPVALERKAARGGEDEYLLAALDSTPETNLSLELRLRDDFSLRFPEFDADAANAVEDYFTAIRQMARTHPRWRVRRYLTLASFSFARIAMYQDLDPSNWKTTGTAVAHSLVRPILRGIATDPNAGIGTFALEYEIDSPTIDTVAPILVHDADSSQHSAIVDAVRGRSFVIEGPPGTGKSQTISNLIASFIYLGKTVLFVSEKMAALEVVKSRLEKVDLGDFCLTLHSSGAKPAAAIEALRRRAERKEPKRKSLGQGKAHIAVAKAEISSHLTALHAKVGPNGESVHDLIGCYTAIEQRRPYLPTIFKTKPVDIPLSITGDMTAIAAQRLEALEDAAQPINFVGRRPNHSPFRALQRTDLFPDEQSELLRALEMISLRVTSLVSAGSCLADLVSEPAPSSIQMAIELQRRVDGVAIDGSNVDWAVAERLTTDSAALEALEFVAMSDELTDLDARLARAGIGNPANIEPEKLLAVGRLVQVLKLTHLTVGDLPGLAAEVAAAADMIESQAHLVSQLTVLLGLERASLALLDTICIAAELVAEADPEWREHCRPGLHHHALSLTEAANRQEKLQSSIEKLSTSLAIDSLTSAEAKGLASTLKKAGFLNGFRKDVRDARKRLAEVWQGRSVLGVDVAVQQLEIAAALLAERDALAGVPVARLVTASGFDPLSVPLRPFALAASWQFRVEDVLSSNDLEVVRIRSSLFGLDRDKHIRLASLAKATKNLRLTGRQTGLPPDTVWDDAMRIVRVRAAGVADLLAAVKASGLKDTVLLGNIMEFAELAQLWQKKFESMQSLTTTGLLAGVMPSTAVLFDTARFASSVHKIFPVAAGDLLSGRRAGGIGALWEALAKLKSELQDVDGCLGQLAALGLEEYAAAALGQPAEVVSQRALELLAAKDELPHFLRFAAARWDCKENPLSEAVVHAHEVGARELLHLSDALSWFVAWTLVRRAAGLDRQAFSRAGVKLDALRRNFAQADRSYLQACAVDVASSAQRRPVPMGSAVGSRKEWTDGALLGNEFAKQRRYVPLRDLLARAGNAVIALTPCVMMSPLTVAQYLKPGGLTFDLVVMDEASQIKPEDAIGALLRGRQTVIVGDPKQLPPTNFFDRALDDDDTDDDNGKEGSLTAGDKVVAESVLDLAARSFQPARRLRWHYRSQHESLIAFSNREFYEDDLIVFPASKLPSATLGIEFVPIQGIWRNRTNAEEARAVAEAATDFMRKFPSLSHGIVTMNQPQRELIQADIDLRSANDGSISNYREDWETRLEPAFVKNLENVQGDERDVIFVSLGWGKTPEGAMHQRFFPINRAEDGHRRLNVLFTRARRKLVIFSSFTPEDIVYDPQKTTRGVRVLRNYLIYARDGRLDAGTTTGRPPDSLFEQAVARALEARNHSVECQVGVAGYFIDIGVRHPKKLASFVVGIECDGATYHSAKSARDRDRLRQEALERLGWRLIRVWSTDWFRNHEAEADRISSEINKIIEADQEVEISETRLIEQLEVSSAEFPTHLAANIDVKEMQNTINAGGMDQEEETDNNSSRRLILNYLELPNRLRRFRDEVILLDYPGSEPDRCILREEMIEVIVRERLDDEQDFTAKVPQWMRTKTDGRQTKYLARICDLVEQYDKFDADQFNGVRRVGPSPNPGL